MGGVDRRRATPYIAWRHPENRVGPQDVFLSNESMEVPHA